MFFAYDIYGGNTQKLVKSEILRKTEHVLDSLQFACQHYRPHKGVEDPTVTIVEPNC